MRLNPFLAQSDRHALLRRRHDGPDQLRQRVAFALSQMLVVSNGGDATARLASYRRGHALCRTELVNRSTAGRGPIALFT
ncbi:hypothetical protein [Sphingomonas sp. BK069]|uniref:hypothetical protein n=1 Tax=Sphingomonas sp. BK069 TaxID=2586979 RepID=UPI00160B28BC|nr:hypothetical protein [Sphingomonas sp. BK069]MBB3348773.1 uncharacterized protein (DUF1800 family) [Sphingomonas sp. BK069]